MTNKTKKGDFTPKKCIMCDKFIKLKQFQDLRSKFHNWCEKYQRPVALCKCQGSQLAKKYLRDNIAIEDISKVDRSKVYNALKVELSQL
ncbi:MAG: hypothetical protein GF329_09260 [Candidatus Lokiarchaeota archaeon]|nr:hypothetical protein [Candidatus Lokiarchaeota archaeon]